MKLRTMLRNTLSNRLERLRQQMLEGELEDDPRHVRGRRAAETLLVRGGASLHDTPGLPPVLTPPVGALEAVLPGSLWDVTDALAQVVADTRRAGLKRLMIEVELSSCLYSERAAGELVAGRELWVHEAGLLRLRPGDRLSKAYLRELQLGDARVVVSSLPLVLLFSLTPAGLSYDALAMDPLGPSREHRRLRGLLEKSPQLAPGAEQEIVRVWRGGQVIELERRNAFYQPWGVGGLLTGPVI